MNQNGSSFGRPYSPSDTNATRSQFLCTVCTYSDTNATRYPQFQYCSNILVDTPGVALPVSVQSSFGFLDDPPGYTASLRRLLKALLTLYRGWHNPSPALNRLTNAVDTHVSGFIVPLLVDNVYLKAVGRREYTFPVPWSSYLSLIHI